MLGLDVHGLREGAQEVLQVRQARGRDGADRGAGCISRRTISRAGRNYLGYRRADEDDVLVTEDGMRNLSEDITTEPADVEAWMRKCWKRKAR